MSNKEVKWFKAKPNEEGIISIGMTDIDETLKTGRVVGLNGICQWDKVKYKDNEYYVSMVSRLGDFGLNKEKRYGYDIRVSPSKVTKI